MTFFLRGDVFGPLDGAGLFGLRPRFRAGGLAVGVHTTQFAIHNPKIGLYQPVLELAQGHYLQRAEPIIMVGNPGLGKTHIATSIALAACRQGQRVRFYNAAGLVNELILAQEEHRLAKFLATALRHQLIVVDELGFIPFSASGAQLIFQFCSQRYS